MVATADVPVDAGCRMVDTAAGFRVTLSGPSVSGDVRELAVPRAASVRAAICVVAVDCACNVFVLRPDDVSRPFPRERGVRSGRGSAAGADDGDRAREKESMRKADPGLWSSSSRRAPTTGAADTAPEERGPDGPDGKTDDLVDLVPAGWLGSPVDNVAGPAAAGCEDGSSVVGGSEFDDGCEPDSPSSATAIPGLLAIVAPMPSATASAPILPTTRPWAPPARAAKGKWPSAGRCSSVSSVCGVSVKGRAFPGNLSVERPNRTVVAGTVVLDRVAVLRTAPLPRAASNWAVASRSRSAGPTDPTAHAPSAGHRLSCVVASPWAGPTG